MVATPARWLVPPSDPNAAATLAEELRCPAPVAALLIARGIHTAGEARTFFTPSLDDLHDPSLMLGVAAAVRRIREAVKSAEPILIYGDYDVDGTVATVLLKTAIERLATPERPAVVRYHVPHRIREGYGIQNSVLAEAAAAGTRLVISVDTGIRAFAAADEARRLALDLIVTDHHLPDGTTGLPDALAVVNPAQPGCPYPNKHLCGAGVAFKLAHALLAAEERTRPLLPRLLPSFLKLVAIATVADSVPLTGENRAITAIGLRELHNPVGTGLRALMDVAGLALDRSPSATEVGFRLGPRINAAGRMDVASDVVELLLTRDATLAAALARKLDELNTARREAEAAALAAIELHLETLRGTDGLHPPECLVLSHGDWHRGVLGILASRVVDRTGRPALVLQQEEEHAHGSGRSVPGFHLLDALAAAHAEDDALFTRFGGHAHAVGFSLPTAHIGRLRERLRLHSAVHLTPELLAPALTADLELAPSDLTPELCGWLARCAPFGQGNPEPVFFTRELELAGPPRTIRDREGRGRHLCLPLRSVCGVALNAMGWTRSGGTPWPERAAGLCAGSRVSCLYRLRENTRPGYAGLDLELVDLRHDEVAAARASAEGAAGESAPVPQQTESPRS